MTVDLRIPRNSAMVHGKHVGLRGGGEHIVLVMLGFGTIGRVHEIAQDVRKCFGELVPECLQSKGARIGYPDFVRFALKAVGMVVELLFGKRMPSHMYADPGFLGLVVFSSVVTLCWTDLSRSDSM